MEFENVKLVKAANVYFDGKVTSRTFYMPDGDAFVSYSAGSAFSVPAQSGFQVKVEGYADYCCSYK